MGTDLMVDPLGHTGIWDSFCLTKVLVKKP